MIWAQHTTASTQESQSVAWLRQCHEVKLLDISLAHVVVVVPLIFLFAIVKRIWKGG